MIDFFITMIVTFIASIVGTISGFGIATLMLPVLITIVQTDQAMLIVTIIHLFNDVWKLVLFKQGIDWSLLLWFGLPSIAASVLGALLITQMPFAFFHRLLGLFLIIYVVTLLLFPSFSVQKSKKTAVAGGILSGFSAGFFGIRGAIKSSFLLSYNLNKCVYLATIGALAMLVDSARLITYFSLGMVLSKAYILGLIFYVPLSFLGAYVGSLIVHKVSQQQFRALVAVFIGVMGFKLFFGLVGEGVILLKILI